IVEVVGDTTSQSSQRFEFPRLKELFLEFLLLFLYLFAVGDVTADGLDFRRLTMFIADGIIFPGKPAPALSRKRALFERNPIRGNLQSFHCGNGSSQVILMDKRHESLTDQFLSPLRKFFAVGIVDEGKPALGIDTNDQILLRFNQAAIALFTFSRRSLGLLAQ